MCRVSLLLILVLISGSASNAQSTIKVQRAQSLILYSEGENFLQPFIENTLKGLKNVKTRNTYSIFSNVSSLNRFLSNSQYQRDLVDLLETQVNQGQNINSLYNADQLKIRQRVIERITNYDLFLVVRTNILGELIEFQFQVFKTIKSNQVNVPYNISDELLASEDIFVNPKEPDYKLHIVNAIKRLFPDSNTPPEASLEILGKKVKNDDVIRVPLNTVITLDGSQSGDYETEQLQYIWENSGHSFEKKQDVDKIIFPEQNSPIQRIKIGRYGNYTVSFRVYDGSAYSNTIRVTIWPTYKSELKIRDTVAVSYQYRSILTELEYGLDYPQLVGKFSFYNLGSDSDQTVLASDKPLPYVLKREIKKGDVDSTIRTIDTRGFDQVLVSTDFLFKQSRSLYMYTFDDAGFLSDPVAVTHTVRRRNVFNVYLTGSTVQVRDINESRHVSSTRFFPEIGFGFFMTKNLEFACLFPVPNEYSRLDDIRMRVAGKSRVALKFHFYEKEKSFRLSDGISSWYLQVMCNNVETDSGTKEAQSFGGGIGSSISIISGEFGNLNLVLELDYAKFVGTDVKRLEEVQFRFGLGFNPGFN